MSENIAKYLLDNWQEIVWPAVLFAAVIFAGWVIRRVLFTRLRRWSASARFIPGFGQTSMDFTLNCRVAEFADQFLVQHELRKRIHRRFREEGVQIRPLPAAPPDESAITNLRS